MRKNEEILEDWKFNARAALMSYQTDQELENHYKDETSILKPFFEQITSGPFKIKKEEFEFSYALKDDELILMMPGTRPVCGIDLWFDFNTDADMELVETNHFGQIISIHKGFLTRYLSMHKSIAELIANQKPEKIRIIGHSMGGALAILAAIEFKAMNQSEERKISCFTLAAPIIGDQRFSKLFEEANIDITRLARADDFLPKLAPIGPYDGYGEEYQIDEYQMTWAFMIIAWGGCICYIPVNIMIPSTGCILVGAHLTHSMNSYIPIIDKIESLDNIKRRKSTNIPEKTIGGLSQWFPLAFLLMVAYARSSLIRLSSFISRQSRNIRSAGAKIRSLEFFQNLPMKS